MQNKRITGLLTAAFLVLAGAVAAVPAQGAQGVQVHMEAQQPVNLNKADSGSLQSIRGIGPALAGRIIAYREANGNFKSTEELMAVKGIGKVKYKKIKNELSV